jgi:hypothetical protein
MRYRLFILTICLVAACKDAYVPPVKSSNNVYLVVEGFINNGTDSTKINLTHTFKLDDSSRITPELHAQVYVEDQAGDKFNLAEIGNGLYATPQLSLNLAIQYRIHIRTSAGKEYVSDYTPVKPSPPIDSVNWTVNSHGLTIYGNTHDPQQSTHYYRWEYEESWRFEVPFVTNLKYVNHKVIDMADDTIYTCYQFQNSTNIILSSSARLSSDVIYEAPLNFIPQEDWRLDDKYSILVKEYALTQDAYNYWSALEKNTELLGTIFGPLPSDVKGNIHNINDSSEEVIGYIGCGAITKQRIFITRADLVPYKWYESQKWSTCTMLTIPEDSGAYYFDTGYWPLEYTTPPGSGYTTSIRPCADCTLAGSNKKPSYWP